MGDQMDAGKCLEFSKKWRCLETGSFKLISENDIFWQRIRL